ncbi:MAG TPA: DMT family transporter [Ferrovibrio sp.]|uniref:DMT family transporter n=1 Tax=Ferrovibrio sp. TaxID=1917215 RepID=UPI002B4B1BB1|nr:DMT family transporter [Ferrovibrio sp.]HLT78962.1 DMT family transporter [Ferrovibrio sp.]
MKLKPDRGDAWLLLTVIIWGNTFPTAKYVLTVLPPTVYASLRYLLAAVTLMIVLTWRQGLVLPRRQDCLPLIGFGLLGITVMQLLWTNALSLTTASKGAILVAVSPIWAMLISSLRGQRPGLRAWCGIILSFGGVFLVINNSITEIRLGGGSLVGDLLFLTVAFCWACYSVFAPPYLARLGALYVSAWSMLFGALALAPFMLIGFAEVEWPAIELSHWAAFLFTAILAGALGYLLWYEGIARLGVARSVVYSYLIPVFALISAVAFLGEQVSLVQLFGAAVVIAGLILTRSGLRS